MTLSIGNVTFDCENPEQLAAFWSEALGHPVDDVNEEAKPFFASIGGTDPGFSPTWLFLKVPEGKTTKNRMHLDLVAEDPPAEIERLVAAGGTHVADKDEWGIQWSVMLDVEGNEFCIATANQH